jgi:antirestriction protein ArdC
VYAFEELIAEMGSVFVCSARRVREVQHDSYVDHWLKVLKSDKGPVPRLPACPGSVGISAGTA